MPDIKRETVKVTRYRDRKTGRYTKKRGRGTKRERYTYTQTTIGQWETGLRDPDLITITKKVGKEVLSATQGNIFNALGNTNVFTELRGAEFVDISLEGRTQRGKRYTLKQSLRVSGIRQTRKIISLMMAKIMGQLEGSGFRVEYPLDMVRWSDALNTRRDTAGLRVLKDATITAKVRK